MGGPRKAAPDIRQIGGPGDFAALFDVSRETIERLAIYETLLWQWQKAVNLVAPGTLQAIWHRHFADSAQLLPLAPPGPRHWIDLGSGAGFPGLVIAILLAENTTREGQGGGTGTAMARLSPTPGPSPQGGGEAGFDFDRSRVTLVESNTRKTAFLQEVVRLTGVAAGKPQGSAVDILSKRAESARIKVNESLPRVVCARALAPLERLLGLAAPLSPPGTVLLLCKGKGIARELREAEKTWKFEVELVPSVTDRDGRIAVITNLERKAKD